MESRDFDPGRDGDAMARIWREIGWLEDKKSHRESLDLYLEACRTRVCEVHGEAEIAVSMLPGTMRVLDQELPLSIVAGVYAGRVGRQQGHATTLTAECVAKDAAEGAAVSTLGIFDSGFYDRLGFGLAPLGRTATIDPRSLKVPRATRPPHRFGLDDAEALQACHLARRPIHGQVKISDARRIRYEMNFNEEAFVLGYRDGSDDAISHFIALSPDGKGQHGPYLVWIISWSTREQFLELLGVLKSLGDQVHGFRIQDQQGISMLDLVDRPFTWYRVTRDSPFQKRTLAVSSMQNRVCDLPRCVEAVSLPGADLAFNLQLSDPIADHLPADAPWRGVGGDWIVRFDSNSTAEYGHDENLPTLEADVGAFTRLWLGGQPAGNLSISANLRGPAELIEALDRRYLLPTPRIDDNY